MIFMKKILLLSTLLCCFFIGCSDDDEGGKNEEAASIVLTSDKTAIVANGIDEVTFSVKNEKGEDVTAACVFVVNGEESKSNTFSTQEAGVYKVKANCGELVSNEIQINAVNENAELKISANRNRLMADGGDFIYLSLLDEDGNDVSDLAVFYADKEKIEGRIYKTKREGMHKITVTYLGKEGKEPLMVSAFAELDFPNRLYVESLTSTLCGWCQQTVKELIPFAKEYEDRFVLVEIHTWGYMYVAHSISSKFASDIDRLYNANGATPQVYINRDKTKWRPLADGGQGKNGFLNLLKKITNETGIAIENHVKGDQVEVTVTIGAKKGYEGRVGIVLVENGFMASQEGFSEPQEMYRLMRAYAPSVEGANFSVQPNTPAVVKESLSLSECKNLDNCWIAVFVMNADGKVENAQHTKLGVQVGYN